MKDLLKIFKSICIILAAFCMTGCLAELSEDKVPSGAQLQVVGRVTPFGEIGTKGTKTADESKVTNMVMMVVDSDDNKIETQYIESDRPLFVIDRSSSSYTGHDKEKLKNCHIYIIANVPAAYITLDGSGNLTSFHNLSNQEIESVNDFLNVDYSLDKIAQPEIGFPMWGVTSEENLDLRTSAEGGISDGVLEIPLECLYSKIVFNISVIPDQIVSGVVQQFLMTSWEVHNVPSKVRVRKPAANDPTENAGGDSLSTVFSRVDNNTNPVMQSGGNEKMTFSFYMPEHKINPAKSISYPDGISDEDKQRFKPQLISDSQRPTYVRINGIYLDHNKREHEVSYDVYLGIDNYKNFHIIRDCQYNNNITIKGITNSKDGAGISLDHRVNKSQNQFKFTLERETLLDSHWEIRPIRITLDHDAHPDAAIKVSILEPSTNNWIRMEMPSNPSGSDYCAVSSTDLAYGKRNYFTTGLVSSTLAGSTSCSFTATEGQPEHTIWVYIDENVTEPASDGSTTREAVVRCEYFDGGDVTGTADVTEDYTFTQRGLHRISNNGHHYAIEYYEEYLYNFDAKEQYGSTTDGMAWGLNGVQLSYQDRALYCEGGWFDDIINSSVIPSINQDLRVYDFYLSTAESADGTIGHPFSGHRFTRRIADKVEVGTLATNANASSAVEYCVNKNKRSSETGKVGEVLWYLPAIDEMEEICKGGYSDFEVFQDKYYWSSQPSYQVYNWSYTGPLGAYLGDYYEGQMYLDNKSHARATKVANDFSVVKSGQAPESAQYKYTITRARLSDDPTVTGPTATGNTPVYELGNQLRTTVNRIRCAYRILKSYTSTFGFETSTSEGIWTSSNFSRNTGTKRTGNASGSFSVTSGWTAATGSATVSTVQYLYAPGQLSFYVMYSGDKPDSSTWTVSVSADNSNWTQVSSYTTLSTSFSQVTVDLSAYQDVYVQIQNSTRVPRTGKTANLFIDDIQLTYTN